ncbi:MAG: T9SS type A sorting domain-containing protein [Cryomorphaceae bacterium]
MKKLYVFTFMAFASLMLQGQNTLLVEHFDYPAGSEIREFEWTTHSGGDNNPLLVTDGGLSWSATAYLGSGIGNAVAVNNTGSDENRPFSQNVTTGSVYASFLMQVPEEVTEDNAGFFFHMGRYNDIENPDFTNISNAFRGRTFVAPGSSPETFRMGLNFNASAVPTEPESLSDELNVNETYLVVMKYEIVEGDDNDLVSLYVFSDGDDISEEPATADIGPFGGTAGDLPAVQLVALRQYDSEQNIIVDGIIAQDSWDMVAPPPPALTGPELIGPADGTSLVVEGDPAIEAVISWTEAENATEPVTYEWQLALRSAGNFDDPLALIASDDDGSATTLTVSFGDLSALLESLGVEPGQTVEAIWRVEATSGDLSAFSVDVFDIDITRGEILSVEDSYLSQNLLLFPNPAKGTAYMRIGDVPSGNMAIRIVNQLGQTVRSTSSPAQSGQQIELNIAGLPAGVYFTVVSMDDMQGVQRLVIQ